MPGHDAAGRGAPPAGEVGARRGILDTGGKAVSLETFEEFREAVNRRLGAADVERPGGLLGTDGEPTLDQELPGIDRRGHPVPDDAVPGFPVVDRPRRGVQAGVTRQRPVVVVDRQGARQREELRRQNAQVVDGEQQIERRPRDERPDVVSSEGRLRRKEAAGEPGLGGPRGDPSVAGDNAQQGMPAGRDGRPSRASSAR